MTPIGTAGMETSPAPPRSGHYRRAALLLTGGLAAGTALAALLRGAGATASMRSASSIVSKVELPHLPAGDDPALHEKPFETANGQVAEAQDGAILVNVDGVMKKYYLPGATTLHDGRTVQYVPGKRFYLMNNPTTEYCKEENFQKLVLPGKTFTVDITLTGVSCGCNVNFYLVDMPYKTPGKDNDCYCDAQSQDGFGTCPQLDMNQGNANVQFAANHACNAPYSNPDHPDWATWECHKWGDPGFKTTQDEFRNGLGGTIDGSKTFTYSQEYKMEGEELTIITTISQGDEKVVKTMGPNEELQSMLKDGSLEKGMVLVSGYWTADDMNWLDGDACADKQETCSNNPAYISNWRITSKNPPATPPPEIESMAPEDALANDLGLAAADARVPSSSASLLLGAVSLAAAAVFLAVYRRGPTASEQEVPLQSAMDAE